MSHLKNSNCCIVNVVDSKQFVICGTLKFLTAIIKIQRCKHYNNKNSFY